MSKKKKIAHIIYGLKTGGAERLLVSLASCIDRDKFEAIVVALYFEGPVKKELEEKGVKVYCLRNDVRFGIADFIRLLRILKRERIDIIHTHLLLADFLGGIAVKLLRLRHLSTVHSSYEVASRCLFYKRKLALLFPHKIICTSKFVLDDLEHTYGLNRKKMIVVYNGIDVTSLPQEKDKNAYKVKLGFSSNDVVILSVGRLEPEKGHRYFLGALKQIVKKYQYVKAMIVGEGSQKESLSNYLRQNNLQKNICLLGQKSDLENIYSAADFFVLPSLVEGLPLALLEAMAYELPIIATGVGGIKEVITHKSNGILINAQDEEALAEALQDALSQRQDFLSLGQRAKKVVKEKFTQEKMVERIANIYETVS